MTIKQALVEYPYIADQIQRIRQGMATMIETRHEPVVTAKLSGLPGGGGISNPTMDQVCSMDERISKNIKRALADIDDLLDAKEMVDNGLKSLDTQERQIIELKYFKQPRMSWKQIRKMVGYSDSQCYKLHKDALEKMDSRKMIVNRSKSEYIGVSKSETLL